ncbi:hypothetical protein TNCV_1472341 [Trichonephila clavipes]|nr:hypothetical protein TNCV_1472341 [Trichonephila clavipes]
MDAMRLSQTLGNMSRSAISKTRTVADGLGRAAMRRPSMSQTCSIGFESTLAITYAVLFQLQACSPPDELYASGIIILENKNLNGYSVRGYISSAYLRPVKVPFRMI